MLVKSYQFTGIDFGHLGQLDPNNMKQSGTIKYDWRVGITITETINDHGHSGITKL